MQCSNDASGLASGGEVFKVGRMEMDTPENPTSLDARYMQDAGKFLAEPMAVVRDPTMTSGEKRAVLASWASDQRAVPNDPTLRRLDNGCGVEIDDVLDALKQLDRMTEGTSSIDRSKRTGGAFTRIGHAVMDWATVRRSCEA